MLDDLERVILNTLQAGLSLEANPLEIITKGLSISEELLLERLYWLKKNGYIRKTVVFFDSDKLGYVGILVALKAAEELLESVALAINRYKVVTHNYERESFYNLWFTLITADKQDQWQLLEQIKTLPSVLKLLEMPACKKYKVNVVLPL